MRFEIKNVNVLKEIWGDDYGDNVVNALVCWFEHLKEEGVTVCIGEPEEDFSINGSWNPYTKTLTIGATSSNFYSAARGFLHEYAHYLEGHAHRDKFNYGLNNPSYLREAVVMGMEYVVMELHGIVKIDRGMDLA